MLKKLFVYDWKSFWKVPTAINLFLVIITIVGIISMVSPFWTLDYEIMDVLLVTALLLYYLAIFAGSIAVSVYTAVRFYRNIYTDEGYLTNTLPVTPRQLVLSKLFVGTIWSFITGLIVCVSILSLVYFAMLSYEEINIFHELAVIYRSLRLDIVTELGMSMFSLILFLIVYIIISQLFSILMLYSAISLGQLFTRHKVAGAVIWYIAEYVIVQIASSTLLNFPFFNNFMNATYSYAPLGQFIRPVMFATLIFTALITVALFFLTEYMLNKRLNLD